MTRHTFWFDVVAEKDRLAAEARAVEEKRIAADRAEQEIAEDRRKREEAHYKRLDSEAAARDHDWDNSVAVALKSPPTVEHSRVGFEVTPDPRAPGKPPTADEIIAVLMAAYPAATKREVIDWLLYADWEKYNRLALDGAKTEEAKSEPEPSE